MIPTGRQFCGWFGLACLAASLVAPPAIAQEATGFDDIAAAAELQKIASQIQAEDVSAEVLVKARAETLRLETGGNTCVSESTEQRQRLEARFEPLKDIDSQLAGAEVWDQRQEIQAELEAVIARQARCIGIVDHARELGSRITTTQATLSQMFLSSRTHTAVGVIKLLPQTLRTGFDGLGGAIDLDLEAELEPIELLWLLIIASAVFVSIGLFLRHRFAAWYVAAGGDDGPPLFKYLVPKPVAEFAPLWALGLGLLLLLHALLTEPSDQILLIRVAWCVLLFAIGCIVINWGTGPLSPSARIDGLIPDHVRPIRLRLRLVILAICFSYAILGEQWSMVRIVEPFVAGRAVTIFLVGIALVSLLDYARNVPGLKSRLRLVRFVAMSAAGLGVIAVFTGFQNLAAFLVFGTSRTVLALFLVWIILWMVSSFLQYLLRQESPAADQVRSSLGLSGKASRSGIGFMQLIADVIVWMLFGIYMIFVWDDSGTTLGQMYVDLFVGWEIGGVSLVPVNMLGGILIFVGIIVVIGWLKRWIDKRWLQHIVFDRGAREAIVTLIGYVGFVIALLVALAMAEVDLTGIALISGALALGIGFGMQEIASNFVSGLILLFERPIRAGDFVTVGETQGFVRRIRIRATEIETLDNQNVLVPNSELVSGRVTNWVLRDTHGRLLVRVGVAYGSDVDKVRDILEAMGRDHPEVITDGSAPAPRALFMGFGDSSLDFELRCRIKHIERRFSIKSDLNFAIDKAFREAGITIPFPQRDLHIIPRASDAADTAATTAAEVDNDTQARVPETRSHSEQMRTGASIDEVWQAITDIEYLKRWLAAEGSFSAQVGGAFNLALRDGYSVAGRIDIFIPPRRFRAAIVPLDDEPPLPTGPVTVEMSLQTLDDGTQLTVTVSGIPNSEDWEEYFRLSVDRWQVALLELRKSVLRK
jgi:small-conductance mechanosensitive channel/uncharacterized protein YndB with AHSA1/START domain